MKEKTNVDSKSANKLNEMRVLTDTHRHRGKPCKKGDPIWVSDQTRKFLEDNKIAEYVGK